MIYMLEFLGLLAVAFSLAASPVLLKVLERFFPSLDEDAGTVGYSVTNARSNEHAEVHDEIRRMTSILENSRRNTEGQRLTTAARK